MKDIPLRFRKNLAVFAPGLVLCILGIIACCALVAFPLLRYLQDYEVFEEFGDTSSLFFSCFMISVPLLPPPLIAAIAGALMAGHHRRAYVTITEEGLTIHDVLLFGKVSHHRFAIKAAKQNGKDLALSIWDRENPKEQRINLGLLKDNDVETLLNWLEGQGVKAV